MTRTEHILGAALALAFHQAGLKVYATARSKSRMANLASHGIQLEVLDVLSDTSIAECVQKFTDNHLELDILVNNAGVAYVMPFSDMSLVEAKKVFDMNVWSYMAVTQAFLPLLLKSKGMIVNQTSVASITTTPFQSIYNASKAAIAKISDSQRLELAPFGIKVVDLKTGLVQSNLINNTGQVRLPKDSLYEVGREKIEAVMRGDSFMSDGMPTQDWANQVVQKLLKKNPPYNIWKGNKALLVWVCGFLPFGTLDPVVKKYSGLDVVERLAKSY